MILFTFSFFSLKYKRKIKINIISYLVLKDVEILNLLFNETELEILIILFSTSFKFFLLYFFFFEKKIFYIIYNHST